MILLSDRDSGWRQAASHLSEGIHIEFDEIEVVFLFSNTIIYVL
ncbi:hypothetical protein SAMN02745220_03116 [Desulfopila aestuarii DSM 18488]|uniref:Uncharacterized protein n=1 Tax=Desulfopila aestuarii DSM 18488 TaxID=1121416 RepID=A0A1M7YBF5_9BACT|nr:hypothetical protein SAMN02745220_03116 [Desulfopila aestuarii DSM 18488]